MKAKSFLQGISILLITTVILLVVAEFFARKYTPIIDSAYPNNSWWFRAKWLETYRFDTTVLSYAIDEHHPVYGWILKPNLRDEKVMDFHVSSNESRIRGEKEFNHADTGKTRILFLGDSFTFGECVNDSDSYPALLEKQFENVESLNTGIHGWGLDQMLLRLQGEGKFFKPSVVILGCLNDDLARNHLWFRSYAKPYFVLDNDSLILKGTPVPSPEEMLSGFHSKFFDWVTSKFYVFTDEPNVKEEDILSEKILEATLKECRKLNAVPVFVYLPWLHECLNGVSHPADAFKKVCERENVLWIDPVDSIQAAISFLTEPEKEFTCHYTPLINNAIAAKIKAQLISKNILSEE